MKLRTARAEIRIIQGDIAMQNADAIVNAANNHLWMGSGVAGALKSAGGAVIEKEAIAKGPIAVGDSIFTSAGKLRAKYVIHAAVMGQDLRTDESKVRSATKSALRVARELNAESVVLPALGTGVGGFPIEMAAEIMIDCALAEVESPMSPIDQISFVLFNEDARRAFESVSRRIAADRAEIIED